MVQLVNVDISTVAASSSTTSSSSSFVEQAGCSPFVVRQPPFCQSLRNCIEPAVWCWSRNDSVCAGSSFSLSALDTTIHYCPINETVSAYCSCASDVPMNLRSNNEDTLLMSDFTSTTFSSSSFTITQSVTSSSTTAFTTSNATTAPSGGLSGGAIAAIVVISVLLVVAVVVLIVWIVIKIKRKRRLEGKYCPAMEEQKSSVKNLPPLPPPNIEGLI